MANLRPSKRQPLAMLLLFAVVLCWCPARPLSGEAPRKPQTVELTIDFGDGFQYRYTKLVWHDDMTVLDVLKQARQHRHPLRFEFRGEGARAFVTSIGRVKNEGARGSNWIFRVGGKLGDRSCGIYPVRAGEKVLWSFQRYP